MRRIGKWAAAVATVLVSVLVSAISAGTAFAAGAPPAGGFWGGAEGGKGIDRSLLLHRDSADWTPAIVMVVAGLLAVAVILALSRADSGAQRSLGGGGDPDCHELRR